MHTSAVCLTAPKALSLEPVALRPPGAGDVVVEVARSGISTGTEKLFWDGTMPPFPGMGYPLVPGYEAVGEVVEAGAEAPLRTGDRVFVPGGDCYEGARGLFGGASRHIVAGAGRCVRVDPGMGEAGALLALAATARHALGGPRDALPDLIVGHGVLGRLLARLTVLAGGRPTVWERDPARAAGGEGYAVRDPEADGRRDYGAIYDASGDAGLLDALVGRLRRGGTVVLAGFYTSAVAFAFPPAFLREMRLRVAAEWAPDDLTAVRDLVEMGALSLDGLISHRRPAGEAPAAYATAFGEPDCLKMILDWEGCA